MRQIKKYALSPKKKTTFDETKKVIVHVAEDRAKQSKKSVQV